MKQTIKKNIYVRWIKMFCPVFLMMFFFSLPVFAADNMVFDHADVLNESEEKQLNQEIEKAKDHIGMDIVIVTTEDAEGKTLEAYADDYYDYGGFGTGKDGNGLLFLMDFDNREIHISTSGLMIRLLDDARIENMLDDAFEYMSEEEYAKAASSVIRNTEHYFDKGIKGDQYSYDRDTGEISVYKKPKSLGLLEILAAIVIPGLTGMGFVSSVKNQYSMKKEKKTGARALLAYRSVSNYKYAVKNEQHINRITSTRIIPRNTSSGGSGGSRSTTHTGSSGRSHGGGGRKF